MGYDQAQIDTILAEKRTAADAAMRVFNRGAIGAAADGSDDEEVA